MNRELHQKQLRERRVARVRSKISGTQERPRLAVRRSLNHIYAQLIDDVAGRTLLMVSDAHLDKKNTKGLKKTDVAQLVGKTLAEQALTKGVKRVVFDRRDKKYHGRVKALADGAREAGLEF
ncbi:50S ribosomal protein L18 [Patescibacteria group bacterium]|nr:50S ribosomal protein L18 [Patescibacteria group bacterium]MBU1034507.1 50S ribosomal protein L18 [Patescibacteria group bacterium]MBU1630001.1 50S ribosomal protein L18 [Patescibacteria group bacterium]